MNTETHYIQQYLAPLYTQSSTYPLDIGDDCAVINSKDKILTSVDSSVEGQHFPKDLNPYYVAYRSVAVAISDIFAMGGIPESYLLSISHPHPSDFWFKAFSKGIEKVNQDYDLSLIGGDMVKGQLAITVTAFGRALKNICERSNAKLGDNIFLTGDLGFKDKDGFVFVKGRIKELIIKGGENISPIEIDEVLYKNENVFACRSRQDRKFLCTEFACMQR